MMCVLHDLGIAGSPVYIVSIFMQYVIIRSMVEYR